MCQDAPPKMDSPRENLDRDQEMPKCQFTAQFPVLHPLGQPDEVINLENQIIPYRKHIRDVVEAATVYCSQWDDSAELEFHEKPKNPFPVFLAFLVGCIVVLFAFTI